MLAKGNKNIINYKTVSESTVLGYYLGLTRIPCVIQNPLRKDTHPSLGFYSIDGKRIFFKDFATGETGGVFDFLQQLWQCNYAEVMNRIEKDIPKSNVQLKRYVPKVQKSNTGMMEKSTEVMCKVREWRDYDLEYWGSFGISKDWLVYADVYPISHKIIKRENSTYTFVADKYAYAYVERKEGKVTIKIYQPLVKDKRYKWCNGHDGSVVSLWSKIPEKGDKVVICSSLKDALCLWANCKIPALAMQGEGYYMSDTAKKVLKERYKKIYCLFDNDEAGLKDGQKFSEESGFTNLVLPKIGKAKDIAELFKFLKNKDEFNKIITNLLNN